MAPRKPEQPEAEHLHEGVMVVGREVVGADPDTGARVVHAIKMDARVIDRMQWAGILTHDQHAAASALRDNWEKARLVSEMKAIDMDRVDRSDRGYKAMLAWDRHRKCLARMGPGKVHILSAVVLHDEALSSYGKRHREPMQRLESALAALVKYCGRVDIGGGGA